MTVPPFRRLLPMAAGLLCLCAASCKSTKKSDYSGVVDYTTPETNLSQEEYPFDEHGNYLADVVSGKKKGSKNKKIDPPKSYVDTYEKPPEPQIAAGPAVTSPNYETPPSASSNSAYAPVYSSGGSGSGSTGTKYSSSASSSSSRKSTPPSRPKPKVVAKAKPKPAAKPKPKAPSSVSYTVKRGDTLYSLANRYGTSVSAIKKASGLSSDMLRDGRTIRIPKK